jgi:hypothetical protein
VLAITPDAAQAISGIISTSELPEGAGLRITSEVIAVDAGEGESGETRTDLRLSLAERPQEGDQVAGGGQVFIEPGTAWMLDDKLLDAEVSGDEVQFGLRDQEPAPE